MEIEIPGLKEREWQANPPSENLRALQGLETHLSDQQNRQTCEIRTYAGPKNDYGY